MPLPMSRYQPLPGAGCSPTTFHSRFSSASVPLLSPRRHERSLRRGDRLQRRDHLLGAGDMRGVGARADDDEVVPRDFLAVHTVAGGDEPRLQPPGRAPARRSASPCAAVASAWPVPCATTCTAMPVSRVNCGRMSALQQAAVLDRGGGGQHDRLGLGRAGDQLDGTSSRAITGTASWETRNKVMRSPVLGGRRERASSQNAQALTAKAERDQNQAQRQRRMPDGPRWSRARSRSSWCGCSRRCSHRQSGWPRPRRSSSRSRRARRSEIPAAHDRQQMGDRSRRWLAPETSRSSP